MPLDRQPQPPPAPRARPPAAGARASGRPHGLPRSARLLRPSEFRRVQLSGRTVDLGPLVVRVAEASPDADGAGARLGLAISRRVGNSVVRNRVKRRVREWFRRRKDVLAGLDLVVTGRPAAAQLDAPGTDKLLAGLLRRLDREPPPPGEAPPEEPA